MYFAWQVQHLCTLLGYGADAVCPYLGIAALFAMQQDGKIPASMTPADIERKYTNALNMGVLKVWPVHSLEVLQSLAMMVTLLAQDVYHFHRSYIHICALSL